MKFNQAKIDRQLYCKTFLLLLLLLSFNSYAKLKIEKINNYIYALVGETSQRSPENFGNNSTHGVVITTEGVILIDSGGSYLGANEIHQTIRKLTNKPIKIIINTGGQDHRWFGNDYFQQLGAQVITSVKASLDHKNREDEQIIRLSRLIGSSFDKTNPSYANQTFDKKLKIKLGDSELQLFHFGPAHTQGDTIVWMPKERVMFSGDVVFVNRTLSIGPARDINSWINVFEEMLKFNPKLIVPGHGHLTNTQEATKDTYDYLVHLRDSVRKVIDDDGDMIEATNINQDKYSYLNNFDSTAKRNAQWVFEILDFED